MSRDLTTSPVDRKKILSDNETIKAVYDNLGFQGVLFDGRYRFTKQQVSNFYEVDVRTIERLLENHGKEIEENGYQLFRGTKLKELRQAFAQFFQTAMSPTSMSETSSKILTVKHLAKKRPVLGFLHLSLS